MFDAHCHLQDERIFPRFDELIDRAEAAGVTELAVKGCREEDWLRVARLAAAYPGRVYPSFGLHPWWLVHRTGNWRETLCRMLLEHPAAGVGEVGLDAAEAGLNVEDQRAVLRDHLTFAWELKRPVTIHCRKAWGALLELLKEFGPFEAGLLIHCYGGSAELIPDLLKYNAWISFSASILRPGNKTAERTVPAVPEDRLLIETDAPDLFPDLPQDELERAAPFRLDGRLLNEPKNLVYVAQRVAVLRGTTPERVATITADNARTLLATEPRRKG